MKPLTIADSATIILGLQDEIRRTEESRYDHRLHGVLLVAHGMTCPEVAALLGDAPRTVEYWIRGFEEKGLVYCLLNRFIFSSDRHILWWSCHAHLLTRCG